MASSGVTRRGESWRARYRHPDTGKQFQRTFKRQADAQRWLREELGKIDRGLWVDPLAGKITFGAFYDRWAARQVWASNTVRAMDLAAKSTPFWDKPIGRIRASDVEAWIKTMSTPTADKPALAPGTIRTRLNNVKAVFHGAVRDDVIGVDPTSKMSRQGPRQRRPEAAMRIPTPEHVRAILEAADDRFHAFVAVCAFAGLRLGEAAGLQVADIDFLGRRISVARQVLRGRGGEVEITLPKYESEREVPIPDQLAQVLASHIALGHRGAWLFQGSGDGPPNQNSVGHMWRKTLVAAGVSGVRLHDLRHFYASGLIAAGCDVVAVQKALGHSKATTTLSTYSHLWPTGEDKTRKAASELLTGVLGAGVGNLRAGGDI